MRKLTTGLFIAMVLVFGLTSTASAILWDRGGGLMYDDVLNVTWTQNMNLAGNTMTYAAAEQWANNLVFQGYSDWRLTNKGTCTGWDCYNTTTELAHLFRGTLNNPLGTTPFGEGFNIGPFFNEPNWSTTGYDYWTAGPSLTGRANNFTVNGMLNLEQNATNLSLAWAVRDGDSVFGCPLCGTFNLPYLNICPTCLVPDLLLNTGTGNIYSYQAVPEPSTLLLLGSGLVGLGFVRRRFKS